MNRLQRRVDALERVNGPGGEVLAVPVRHDDDDATRKAKAAAAGYDPERHGLVVYINRFGGSDGRE